MCASYGNALVLFNEPLAPRTTFKVGGCADIFVEPADIDSLCRVLYTLQKEVKPFFILAGGSNVVISDAGIRGTVISTKRIQCIQLKKDSAGEAVLYAECGCSIEDVTAFCAEHALSGLENFAGLPGTIGGALFMNARCYERSISDVLVSAEYFQYNKNTTETACYRFCEDDWEYKKSPFQTGGILENAVIVSAVLRVTALECSDEVKHTIAQKNAEYLADRSAKGHFRFPSAGSVFKNNRIFGIPSGKIIDEAGLRGYAIGGAQIAPWHGNFIINAGDAASSDIQALVDFIIKTVKEKTGFDLEPEILFI